MKRSIIGLVGVLAGCGLGTPNFRALPQEGDNVAQAIPDLRGIDLSFSAASRLPHTRTKTIMFDSPTEEGLAGYVDVDFYDRNLVNPFVRTYFVGARPKSSVTLRYGFFSKDGDEFVCIDPFEAFYMQGDLRVEVPLRNGVIDRVFLTDLEIDLEKEYESKTPFDCRKETETL